MNPPGRITLSPAAKPIFTFIEAADKAIQTEHRRLTQLWRYGPASPSSHEAWEALRAEHERRVLELGPLGAEAIRAGRLAGEAARTGELVRRVTACVRGLEGWVAEWWRLCREEDWEWRRRGSSLQEVPPELLDEAMPMLRAASEAMVALTNELHIIAIAVPAATRGTDPSVTAPEAQPTDEMVEAMSLESLWGPCFGTYKRFRAAVVGSRGRVRYEERGRRFLVHIGDVGRLVAVTPRLPDQLARPKGGRKALPSENAIDRGLRPEQRRRAEEVRKRAQGGK